MALGLFSIGLITAGVLWVDRPSPTVVTESARPYLQRQDTVAQVVQPVSTAAPRDVVESHEDTTATVADTADSASQPARRPLVDKPIRIQLLNGTKVKGLARTFSQRLRQFGFDVREVGNAGHFGYTKSQLIDRTGGDSVARIVADSLGVEYADVSSAVEARLVDIDVTFVLGADYQNLKTTK